VANFRTDIRSMDAHRFVPALNALLPRDVRVLESREASADFHARFDAKSRSYRFHVVCGRPALPHELRYAIQLWRRPRIDSLNAYARCLLGEIDCSTFASPRDPSESRMRHISQAYFHTQGDTLIFEISANAFLWKMVRSILGSLLHYEELRMSPADFARIVSSADHSMAGPTAPPEGLFLWKIAYYRD
jgi:tRNA pseudouridine38-40 synthase